MANTSYTIRPSADGNQYSNYPSGDYSVPPNVPTGLAAFATGKNVSITWIDTNSASALYLVERSVNTTAWTVIATSNVGGTSYSDNGLSSGVWYYRVRARSTVTQQYSNYTGTVSATISQASSVTFNDSFENGSLNGPGTPFAWDNGKGGHGVISTTRAYTGAYSVRIPQYADGGQLPFDLGAEYRCVRVTYRFWVPANYRTTGSGANNKLIRLWPGGGANNGEESYGFRGKMGASLWADNQYFGSMQIDVPAADGSIGPIGGHVSNYINASMFGAWHQASWLFRGATTANGTDSTADAWLNGTNILSLSNIPSNTSALQKFRYGYLFGWANSAYVNNPTDFFVDDVSFECGENL